MSNFSVKVQKWHLKSVLMKAPQEGVEILQCIPPIMLFQDGGGRYLDPGWQGANWSPNLIWDTHTILFIYLPLHTDISGLHTHLFILIHHVLILIQVPLHLTVHKDAQLFYDLHTHTNVYILR